MNIANTTYNNYETGKREPDKETLKRFANFYHCSIDYLLGYSDIRNPYTNTTSDEKRDDQAYRSPIPEEDELFSIKQFKEFLKEQKKNREEKK